MIRNDSLIHKCKVINNIIFENIYFTNIRITALLLLHRCQDRRQRPGENVLSAMIVKLFQLSLFINQVGV